MVTKRRFFWKKPIKIIFMYLFQGLHTLLFLNPSLCFVIWMFFFQLLLQCKYAFLQPTLWNSVLIPQPKRLKTWTLFTKLLQYFIQLKKTDGISDSNTLNWNYTINGTIFQISQPIFLKRLFFQVFQPIQSAKTPCLHHAKFLHNSGLFLGP